MRDLCISTYTYGWYQDFIPLYIYSILFSFPQHHVKIFTKEPLSQNNINSLNAIKDQLSSNFEIVENYNGVDCTYIKHFAAVRYFIPRHEFEGFKYVYMGDVDMIVIDEYNDDFTKYYLDHCTKTGLPFSNEVTDDNNKMRTTGLHFMILDPYYDKMEPFIREVVEGRNAFANSKIDSFSYDEEVLYDMVNRAFDLTPLQGYRRPHHGVHLGYVRDRPIGHSYARKTRLKIWERERKKIEKVFAHPLFDMIVNNMGPKAKECMNKIRYILDRPLFL